MYTEQVSVGVVIRAFVGGVRFRGDSAFRAEGFGLSCRDLGFRREGFGLSWRGFWGSVGKIFGFRG